MKKRGFTLAELLIVLGITGVIAAVVLPLAAGLLPDKNKMMYLKVYDELGRNISHIASDSSLFPVCINTGSENIGCQDHPLLNTVRPSSKKFDSSNYEGNKKLCNLLAFNMNAESTKCSDSSYSFDSSSFNSDFNTNKSFTTQNGMEWWIVPQVNTKGGGNAEYQTDIYVDVDSSDKSPNCIYDSESCKNPDRFKFLLAADGTVIPADPMGLMYIETRKSFLKNKNQKVSDTTIESNLTDKLKKFEYQPCIESHFIEAANDCVNGGGVWDNYTNTCTCANTEEYWDDSAKTCRNPRLECEAAGNTWVDGVCKTPEPEPEPEPEPDPVVPQASIQVMFSAVPVRGYITKAYDPGSVVEQIPFGSLIYIQSSGIKNSDTVRAGIDIKGESYVCNLTAERGTCFTRVVNSAYLPINTGTQAGEPYAVSSQGNTVNIQKHMDALTSSGYWTESGMDFTTKEGSVTFDNIFHRIASLSGCYITSSSTKSASYGVTSNKGERWFLNQTLPSPLTGNTSLRRDQYNQDAPYFEVFLESELNPKYKQFYQ